jgi:hypothetical protein
VIDGASVELFAVLFSTFLNLSTQPFSIFFQIESQVKVPSANRNAKIMIVLTPSELRDHQFNACSPINVHNANNVVDAKFWIGYCHYFNTGGVDETNTAEAMRIWWEALLNLELLNADNNDTSEQDYSGKNWYFYAGELHLNYPSYIEEVQAMLEKAYPRLEWEASVLNDRVSQHCLAECFQHGYGSDEFPEPYKLRAFLFEQAASQGHPNAQVSLGDCYHHGWGVPKDPVAAIYWYENAIRTITTKDYKSQPEMLRLKETAGIYRNRVLRELCPVEQSRIIGRVQHNHWMEGVRNLVEISEPSPLFLALLLTAVQSIAAFDTRRLHSALSHRTQRRQRDEPPAPLDSIEGVHAALTAWSRPYTPIFLCVRTLVYNR